MVPAVFVSEVGPILRLGLRDVLSDAGIDVVTDLAQAHAAVVDLDDPDRTAAVERLVAARPGITVIACSSQRPAMVVVVADGEPADPRPLTAGALREVVRRAATIAG